MPDTEVLGVTLFAAAATLVVYNRRSCLIVDTCTSGKSGAIAFGYIALFYLASLLLIVAALFSAKLRSTASAVLPLVIFVSYIVELLRPWASDTVTYSYDNGRLRSGLTLQQPTGNWTNGYTWDAGRRLSTETSQAGTFSYNYGSVAEFVGKRRPLQGATAPQHPPRAPLCRLRGTQKLLGRSSVDRWIRNPRRFSGCTPAEPSNRSGKLTRR